MLPVVKLQLQPYYMDEKAFGHNDGECRNRISESYNTGSGNGRFYKIGSSSHIMCPLKNEALLKLIEISIIEW